MIDKVNYVKIDDVIKVIENAADKKIITPKVREILIQEIYETGNPRKYKSPEYKK